MLGLNPSTWPKGMPKDMYRARGVGEEEGEIAKTKSSDIAEERLFAGQCSGQSSGRARAQGERNLRSDKGTS